MAASLPNELLQQILGEVVDQTGALPARCLARRRFSRVCSAWHHSILNPWQEVLVSGAQQALRLAKLLEGDAVLTVVGEERVPARAAVRALALKLSCDGAGSEDDDVNLARLLGCLADLDQVEVSIDCRAGMERGELGPNFVAALCAKTRMKRFAIAATSSGASETVTLSRRNLSQFAEAWTQLESLDLDNCSLLRPWNTAPLRFASTRLSSFSIDLPRDYDLYPTLVNGLPPSLRTLSLSAPNLSFCNPHGRRLDHELSGIASQLTHLTLYAANRHPYLRQLATNITPGRLARLETLSVTPNVFRDWTASIKVIKSLRKLELTSEVVQGPSVRVRADEVVELLGELGLLERLTLDQGSHGHWREEHVREVQRAADERSIKLELA